jgi:hypothetical protein
MTSSTLTRMVPPVAQDIGDLLNAAAKRSGCCLVAMDPAHRDAAVDAEAADEVWFNSRVP